MRYLFTFGPIFLGVILILNLFSYLGDRDKQITLQERERTIQAIVQKEGVNAAEKYKLSSCPQQN